VNSALVTILLVALDFQFAVLTCEMKSFVVGIILERESLLRTKS